MNSLKLIILYILFSNTIYAQWSNDPDENLQLTNWGDTPISAIEDGKGGAFISTGFNGPLDRAPWYTKSPSLIWIDKYGYHNLYTARILGGSGEDHRNMKLLKDGTGNYLAVFVDQTFLYYIENTPRFRDRVIVQKFDSFGNVLWGDGIYITNETSDEIQHTLFETVSDGNGGCFIYYEEWDSLYHSDQGKRVVQRISRNGQRLWGDKGIILYEGRIAWNHFANNLLFDGNNGIITYYQNEYLINLNQEGEILWQLPVDIQPNEHYKMTLINNGEFALFHYKYEPPLGRMLMDKISLQGYYLDRAITIIDSTDGDIIEDVFVKGNNIFIEYYGYTNYIKKIDLDGNNCFGNRGILLFDSLGYLAEMFPTDSSIVVVTDHYAQAIDFEGNNLWDPPVLQYSTRYMGYHDFISDGNGGFIAFWLYGGVWGQQVSAKGKLGDVVTNIIDTKKDIIPDNYILYQNYPNPFNPSTTITYSLPVEGYIELKLFDILGREIAILENGEKAAGTYTITFNTKDFQFFIPSGVYFYTLFVKDQSSHLFTYQITKKMLLLK